MEVGARTSRSLSCETSDHLNSACPPRVPPRMGSNIATIWVNAMEVGCKRFAVE